MKKVVIVSASPRRGGNSEVLATEFANGAKSQGHQVEMIKLRKLNLNYCLACYNCKKKGKCVHNDGMAEILDKMLEADVIVFSTPVYFYSMCGQLKVFIDRLVPIYEKIRADIYLIATQWDKEKEFMEQTFEAIRGCTRDCFIDCPEKGVLYGVALDGVGAASKRYDYLQQAYDMGKNV